MLRRLLTLVFLLISGAAYAQADSISIALGAVDGFHKTASSRLKESGLEQTAEAPLKASLEDKKRVKDDLRSFGISLKAGPERGRMIFKAVDAYMEDVIESLKDVQYLPEEDQARMDKVVEALGELKDKKLDELSAALSKENVRKRHGRRVPLIEDSPHVTSPDDAPGIWAR